MECHDWLICMISGQVGTSAGMAINPSRPDRNQYQADAAATGAKSLTKVKDMWKHFKFNSGGKKSGWFEAARTHTKCMRLDSMDSW